MKKSIVVALGLVIALAGSAALAAGVGYDPSNGLTAQVINKTGFIYDVPSTANDNTFGYTTDGTKYYNNPTFSEIAANSSVTYHVGYQPNVTIPVGDQESVTYVSGTNGCQFNFNMTPSGLVPSTTEAGCSVDGKNLIIGSSS
ncbi:MAG: hypothetical protein A3E87_00890 [Gammaproteobacteria bacterium RIFCSPHIGHO2_12_FULL_35_23]|nr:MAG: hypothetical protein A3E87_00890 [Gammaproteobacteria bacterium RIFCSPHIGHO2_12_FULL_35_23]